MATAAIKVNGVTGSNTNLPINTSVALTNGSTGGESTFLWEIIDQPTGTADSLSGATTSSASFTPKKEGTYLIQLTVNGSITDRVVCAVPEMKSGERIPAGNETDEASTTIGWAAAANALLKKFAGRIAKPGTMFAVGDLGTTWSVGQVGRISGVIAMNSGLPGEEVVAKLGTNPSPGNTTKVMAVVEEVLANTPNTALGTQGLIVRVFGVAKVATIDGSPAADAPVYATDGTTTGISKRLTTVPTTTTGMYVGRILGQVGADWYVMFDGMPSLLNNIAGSATTVSVVTFQDGIGLSLMSVSGGAGTKLTSDGSGNLSWT